MSYCPICHSTYTPPEKVAEVEITFFSDGEIITATAKRYSDAFYEITKGKYRGNLVHRWDIISSNVLIFGKKL
jgi:hypothetical protein